ncbi:3'-5' exonuclease [Lentzea sp. E54]|uniref:3'-5' exonuclease n=1 Tax=Lentzea xerophila TaxID=3435883 RepID=UPI003DA3B5A5
MLTALSSGYQRSHQLDEAFEKALDAFGEEVAFDGDPIKSLKRLSELDAVRILTIHKRKGMEFEKVVVLAAEEQFFRGEAALSEFFVAIFRAKNELVLTHHQGDRRARRPDEGADWIGLETALTDPEWHT